VVLNVLSFIGVFLAAVAVTGPLAVGWNPFEWQSAPYFVLITGVLLLRMLVPSNGSRWLNLLRELLLVIPAAVFYFLVRGLVDARGDVAEANAQRIIDLEQRLGIYRELDLQGLIDGSQLGVNIVNWIYIWGHWPLITIIVLWLVLFHRNDFPLYRNAFLISGLMGMVVFALFPVAPPRLMPDLAFVDTVTQHSRSYRVLQPPALTNPFAAMPSLHFGWNLLMGIAVARQARTWWLKGFGVLMPLLMLTSIVLTGNHYFLDGVVGGLFVGIALLAAASLPRLRETFFPQRHEPPHEPVTVPVAHR
jgi:membrane-associated phospholipid phosphatase